MNAAEEKDYQIWLHKLDNIFRQFVWLEGVTPKKEVRHAYVKRFVPTDLHISTGSVKQRVLRGPKIKTLITPRFSMYLVDSRGKFIVLGKKTNPMNLCFWKPKDDSFYDETVAQGLERVADSFQTTYIVAQEHNPDSTFCPSLSDVLVLKPPMGADNIHEWYEKFLLRDTRPSINFKERVGQQ
jgi:hypothetical protein